MADQLAVAVLEGLAEAEAVLAVVVQLGKEIMVARTKAVAVVLAVQVGHFQGAHSHLAGHRARAASDLRQPLLVHQYFMLAAAVVRVIQEALQQAQAAMVEAEQAVKQIAQTPHLEL